MRASAVLGTHLGAANASIRQNLIAKANIQPALHPRLRAAADWNTGPARKNQTVIPTSPTIVRLFIPAVSTGPQQTPPAPADTRRIASQKLRSEVGTPKLTDLQCLKKACAARELTVLFFCQEGTHILQFSPGFRQPPQPRQCRQVP